MMVKILKEIIIKNINSRRDSSFTSLGVVFAERYKRTFGKFLRKPVFKRGGANWVDVMSTVIKQCNNTIHHSTKMAPRKASRNENERTVSSNLQEKRRKQNQNITLDN